MTRNLRGALLGVGQTLAIAALFVGGGLGWAGVTRGWDALRPPAAAAYPAAAMPRTQWLVDGFNVIQVGLLGGQDREGWWREERRRQLLALAGRLAGPDEEVVVVFDGPRPADTAPEGAGAQAVFAPDADAWLLARVRDGAAAAERIRVVTADRSLAERARRRGAEVVAPREFLARCEGPPLDPGAERT